MGLILFGPTQRRTTPTSSTRSAEASFSFILYLTIFTMLHDDITHPIPDPTDTITEGQVFVDSSWHARQISPPINMQASLSLLINQASARAQRAYTATASPSRGMRITPLTMKRGL